MTAPAPSTPNTRASNDALPAKWVERLFQRLHGQFGNVWLDKWRTGQLDEQGLDIGVENAKSVWAHDLFGYSAKEIRAGLLGCKSLRFPPSLPEFLSLCRPPVDYANAWAEVQREAYKRKTGRDVWSRNAIFWAHSEFDEEQLQLPHEKVKEAWKTALDAAIREGKDLVQIPLALDAPAPIKMAKGGTAMSRHCMAKIRETLGKPSPFDLPADSPFAHVSGALVKKGEAA